MRWLLFFLFGVRLCAALFDEVAPSTPDEIASLNADLVIEGYVSAASGQLSIVQTDLHVKGAQDLLLQRTYLPPQILGRYHDDEKRDRFELGKALLQLNARGWVVLPHLWAGYNLNSPYFQVRDPHGTVLEFEIEGNRGRLRTAGFGCSNLVRGEPSAKGDIRNTELWVEGDRIRVISSDGTQRIYQAQWAGLYRLDSELLSNGKAIRYFYNGQVLERISSTDASGMHAYATIECAGSHHYKSLDGREVCFSYENRKIKGRYKKGHLMEAICQIPVLTLAKNPTYQNSAGYNERTLLTSYDTRNYPVSCTYWQKKKSPCRIRTFSTPSGTTSFEYNPAVAGEKEGATTVTHPNGSQTIYRFNASFLLIAIENWFEGKLYNQKLFSYDSKQHISRIETQDGIGNSLLVKTYECDQSGNPVLEIWEGDFGVFKIRRTFSKNRLIKEESSDGLGLEYTYLGDTHLITSKSTLLEGMAIRKTTCVYDEANNLIEEAEQGKTVTTYLLIQEGAHLHLPQWKIEKDWEGNLIHKTCFSYDQWGNLAKEAHYGSDGLFAYETTRLYDSCGNLLEETNPIGQKASYQYDERGRQVREIPFSQHLTIQRTFDEKGRLTLLQEGDHSTYFFYNSSDELIRKINYLGLETHYFMHPIHGKPLRIEEKPTLLEIDYDDFGREISRKDAYGATTITESNSYGDPLSVIHPDGSRESFSYASNRNLLAKTDPDGLTIAYAYDPLKRILSKVVGTRKTTYTYDAYHLLEEKDPLGATTTYRYNASSQKIEETRGGRTIRFYYDSLGFLSRQEKGSRWISFHNDVLGRVLSKSIDGHLNRFYTYDSAGNLASSTQKGTTYYRYDPYNRLIETINADGFKTTISYEEKQGIFIKTILNPKGVKCIETFNAHGLLLKKEVPGCLLEEYSYDRALRLASQDQIVFSYTPGGSLSSQTEAGRRTTSWTYTPGGKIRTQTKPNGAILAYEYTPDGDLARMGFREFDYDSLGRLIAGTGFSREYDLFGNVIKEELATGLTLETTYDDSDRPLIRILPDQSRIHYEYNGPFLTKVSRIDASGRLLYNHTYDQFDPDGRVLSETGAFATSYNYDQMGRCISQSNPYFSEELAYDSAGNLVRKGNHFYGYDDAGQLTSSKGEFALRYDTHHNRTNRNGDEIQIDELNQIEGLSYDANGNLTLNGFTFDEFDQLAEANGETYCYDALGRRLQKGNASYLYFGDEEVGFYENGKAKELKIPGFVNPIAIEINSQAYFPIADIQGTLRLLIDSVTAEICRENACDPFGVGITPGIPYAYAGKRYDPETGLVYFGKRYYFPALGRWLTPDPIGSANHSNLYQYLFNNPFAYQDSNGEFAFAIPLLFWGAELAVPVISACVTAMIYGTAAGAVAYGGYKLVGAFNDRGHPSMGDYYSGNLTSSPNSLNWTMKSGSVDPTLPTNPDDLLKRPGWKETTHPEAGKKGHRTFENGKTGEKLRHDKGKPWETGHKAYDHYHRPNPNATGRHDEYLDGKGNPTRDQSDSSHIYSPEGVWWN